MALSPLDLFKLTYLSLKGNPLRSGLTSLGVFMGVTAVSATLQVGNISQTVIERQLNEREAPQVGVGSSWQRNKPFRRLQLDDMEYLQERLIQAEALSALTWVWYRNSVTYLDREANPEIYAVSRDYLKVSGRRMTDGKFFSRIDFENYRPVLVIDDIAVDRLFPDRDPIGERVYIDGRPFIVRGVIETKLLEGGEEEPQGTMYMPITVWQALSGRNIVHWIAIRARRLKDLEILEQQAVALLEKRYPDHVFRSSNNVSDILAQQETLKTVSRSLLAVGGIALLVGGVGIANITIASVMERTAEIGLRLAIGAKPRDVMLQFVLEATVLSVVGGVGAIATVHFITVGVSNTFDLPYEFDGRSATLALGSAFVVGVGAGFLPALRASRLDPVSALRS
ncbi:ABC transporter permease [Baaleninema simplex]|uniref:ABC transporter permease n=1 Tax=Baaleninema simplex TaxID=2862350 RepID=UPI000345AFD4|nr:ABC transporter permease [Baaleninema simplex]